MDQRLKIINHSTIIYIYHDTGTCARSVKYTQDSFAKHTCHPVELINAAQIIAGDWMTDAAALIIPGGADLPYVRKLAGLGNQRIKAYVENGGTYIGICAGAYYGSRYIEFDKAGPRQVIGTRELAFFPGSIHGPTLAPFDYHSPSGARLAVLKAVDPNHQSSDLYHCYYNGGGHFVDTHQYPNVSVLYQYQDQSPDNFVHPVGLAAIIECQVGGGRAILSSVHFEWQAQDVLNFDHYQIALSVDHQSLLKIIATQLSDRTHIKILKDIISTI